MRIVRYTTDGTSFGYGVLDGAPGAQEVAALVAHPPLESPRLTSERFPLGEVVLAAPVVPGKAVCIGRNYADHAAEMGSEVPEAPLVFVKPSTTVIGPDAAIVHPAGSERVDGQWTRGKGHDTCCPLEPWIETELDPAASRVTTEFDGATVQDGATSLLLHNPVAAA